MNKFTIGNNIRRLRHDRGWTQPYMAALIGISKATLSKIENDIVDISFSRLEQIAAILDIPETALLTSPDKRHMEINALKEKLALREKEIAELQGKIESLLKELAQA